MRVVTNAIAPKYSIYFGAPRSADCSIISKSKTRLNAARPTTKKDNHMEKLLEPESISGEVPVTKVYMNAPI